MLNFSVLKTITIGAKYKYHLAAIWLSYNIQKKKALHRLHTVQRLSMLNWLYVNGTNVGSTSEVCTTTTFVLQKAGS
jgi:hypothetical protein